MKLKVNDKKELELIDAETLLSGNVNSYDISLVIDESYKDFVITLIWKNGDIIKKSIITNETESVKIPHEVLVSEGELIIGLFAEKVENEKLIQRNSVNLVYLPVTEGSYTGEGTYTEEIDATILQKYLQQMQEYYNSTKEEFLRIAEEKKTELNDLSTELEQGLNEVAEQGVSQIIDTYTEKTTELEEKIASGEYNGATFTPSVDNDGNLSWSNDKGLPNPETINVSGPQGPVGPVGPAGAVKVLVVDELPAIGEEGVLYFVRKEDATETDLYDEYMYIDEKWEYLGTRTIEIDLDDYYKKEEVDGKLTDYVKFTDHATFQKPGVIIPYNGINAGLSYTINTGILTIYQAKKDEVLTGITENKRAIPILTGNMQYALKVAISNNQEILTSEEKKSAQDWLGVTELIGNIDELLTRLDIGEGV